MRETGALTRRRALQFGATAAGAVALGVQQSARSAAATEADVSSVTGRSRERSFDEGWLFLRGDADGAQEPSYDDRSWRTLDLPHDWSIEDLPYATSTDGGATSFPSLLVPKEPDPAWPTPPQVIGPFDPRRSENGGSIGYTVGGVGWYRKHFEITDPTHGRRSHIELRFDGVYQNADVWLNGVHLGFHPNGYTTFAYDLTPHLDPTGTNVLAVRVDNSGRNSRWYAGSGIYRHTWLTVTGPVRVPLWGVHVTTPEVSTGRSTAHVEVSVANLGTTSSSAQARVTVLDPHGKAVAVRTAPARDVDAGATAVSELDLPVRRAALWSMDSPSLYTARTEILVAGRVVDTVTTRFGIRSLEWNGEAGLLLNGEPVKIMGGNVHHDHGPMGAVALDRSEERRVEILKEAGFNSIRTAHNPPTPALLDACDRLGMLVMDEFFDVWDTGKNPEDYSVHFAEWWERDLTGTVLRDRNHPSVVMWSLGNEITDRTGGHRGAQLAAKLRTLDTTRPITLGGGSTHSADDPSWNYVDIGDVHYNANGKGYAQMHAAHPDKAMTHNETFPATIHQDIRFADAHDWAVGTWIWAAWDYLGEAGIGKTPIPPVGTGATIGDQSVMPGWSISRELHHGWGGFGYAYPYFQGNCGDFDLIGQRKPQSHWRDAVTGRSPVELLVERPTPPGTEQVALWWGYFDELAGWTWDDVQPGHPMTVHVYTAGDSARLLLNGVEVPGGPRAPERSMATFTVPYEPGELTAVAERDGKEIGRTTLRTVGAPAALRLVSDVKTLTTGRDDLAHVLVEVVDSHGRVCPDATYKVTFEIDGAGELAGVANGNPHNVDSFKRPSRYTWHGKALAILRPAKRPGRLTLVARATGLRPATLTLPVRR
ncbi:glycoside hydrolase family 2 TIM barrel-domain containing protein [Streptomyces ipomoeae]|uniref:glycoside hydrolase family 2 TIM barrel-domain containing protein n=1 Tax=Streptomyces ipomoeae TaxID=103232 RepID=UPI0015F0CB87|nr:glycoside hydrolase family 2 TIM barrel-domain containing protein [Streptomyces ipomoeae]MDX2937306.1 glycoside hydrolase family 2 TIM barrel-domain containing protein [Streptomyces ipomoeae]